MDDRPAHRWWLRPGGVTTLSDDPRDVEQAADRAQHAEPLAGPQDGEAPARRNRLAQLGPVRRRLRTTRLVAVRSITEFLRDGSPDLAASLTFFGVLSLFPAILAAVSLLGVFGQGERTVDAVMGMLSEVAPVEVVDPIRGPIEALVTTPAAGTALIVGIVVALWTSSRYVSALGRAMNAIYGVEEGRPIWVHKPTGVLLTTLLIAFVAVGGLALVFTGPIAERVGDWIGLGETALAVWRVAKWPAAAAAAILALATLYRFAPNISGRRFHWISLGAGAALIVVGLATAGFNLYVSISGSFSRTYGPLTGIIVFLVWMWLVNMAVLYGARLDAEVLRVRQLKAGLHAEEAIDVTPRSTSALERAGRRRRKMLDNFAEIREDAEMRESSDTRTRECADGGQSSAARD